MNTTLGDFTFRSDFDSGNLHVVNLEREETEPRESEVSTSKRSLASSSGSSSNSLLDKPGPKRPDYVFEMTTRPDGYGELEIPSKNRTWFYYSVTYSPKKSPGVLLDGKYPTVTVEFKLMGLNKVTKLFAAGMRPYFKSTLDDIWRRVPIAPVVQMTDSGLQLEFIFTFSLESYRLPVRNGNVAVDYSYGSRSHPAPPGTYYFAYSLPYSYSDLQKRLLSLENGIVLGKSKIPRAIKSTESPRIYYHREVLISSVDGHRLDLLTISSMDDILTVEEPTPEGLFPKSLNSKRCKRFIMADKESSQRCNTGGGSSKSTAGKIFMFVSARVHPAETISSYMLDGFLSFILSSDPRAILLRSIIVFKIIPMLNPDGVYRGHYRGDAQGVNLNRVYDRPDPELHPTIWATKTYITEVLVRLGHLKWYFDFHGHANKWGTFLLGNWLPSLSTQMDQVVFSRCLYINCPLFDLGECDFSPKGMLPDDYTRPTTSTIAMDPSKPFELERAAEKTKDGTGRVAIYRATGSTHCYTYEANYHGLKQQRRALIKRPSDKTEKIKKGDDKRFTVEDMKHMGKVLAVSVLDVQMPRHPSSRVPLFDSKQNIQSWGVHKLRRLYEKARQPIDEGQILSLLLQESTFQDR